MADRKSVVNLNESEASVALMALRYYLKAEDFEVDLNVLQLEAKLDASLGGNTLTISKAENIASILGARGGTKGGASKSEAKRAAAAANGAKGGRPRKPNLFIKFAKAVWQEPDPKLLNSLYLAVGNNSWLPDEQGDEKQGPYVRVYVPEIDAKLEKLLRNSLNVFEWDTEPFFRLCDSHKNDICKPITPLQSQTKSNCSHGRCTEQAKWIY